MVRYALAAVLAFSAAPALAADGKALFEMQCKMCHGGSPIAPSLVGVLGRPIASTSFAYSPGLKAKGGKWTAASLDAFLKSPPAFAPGTKMPISVADPAARTAIIGYLKTLK